LRLALAGTLYYRATRGDWRDDQIQSRIDEADRARQILEQLSSESIESAIIREDVAAAFAATLGGLSDLEAKRTGTTGHVAALGWARKVLALQDARVANDPNNARIKYNASGANGTLTGLLLDLGRADEALPYAKRGVELLREVAAASPMDNSAAINLLFRLYALATAQLEAKLVNEATASHDEFMRRWDAMPSDSREIPFAVVMREMERGVASRLSARASQSPSSSASERVKNCNAAIDQASMLRRYAIANPSRVTSPVPNGDPLQDVLTDLKRCAGVVVVPTIWETIAANVCKADCIAPKYLLRRKLGAQALPQELQEANDQRLHDRKDFLTVIASLPQTTLVVLGLAHVLLQFFHGFDAVQRATELGSQLVLVDGIAEAAAAYLIQNFRWKLLNHQLWKTGIFKLGFGLRSVFHVDIPW
jgi:hypothetical protein